MYVVGLNAKDMILMYMAHSVVKTCIFIQSKNGEKSRERPWRNLIDTMMNLTDCGTGRTDL